MRGRLPLLALLLGALLPPGAAAATPSPAPAALPTPVAGRAVYDTAGIWTTATIDEAEGILATLRDDTGTQVAAVSLPTGLETVSEAQAIGDASLIMKRFGVGTQGRNDGLVVLFDLDTTLRHGQIRIYPGYDLEAAGLPPDVAQAIFEQDIAPLAAAGDLDGALLGGLVAIDSTLREAAGLTGGTSSGTGGGPAVAWTPGPDEPVVVDEPGIPTFGGPLPDPGGGPGAFLPLFILVGIAGVAFSLITGAGRRGGGGDPDVAHRAWWSRNDDDGPRMGGGSWGGSDGGGGSGGFGGGGDSGGSGGGGGAF